MRQLGWTRLNGGGIKPFFKETAERVRSFGFTGFSYGFNQPASHSNPAIGREGSIISPLL
ncbi:MAG: hypothetical protein DYG96_09545 [Chlorobi bacterium CHB2]|nr:hypothetical protein [Chlorobi bacterium CHB2]